jgi:hypothetical protein
MLGWWVGAAMQGLGAVLGCWQMGHLAMVVVASVLVSGSKCCWPIHSPYACPCGCSAHVPRMPALAEGLMTAESWLIESFCPLGSTVHLP